MHKKQDFLIRVIEDEQYVLDSLALLLDVNGIDPSVTTTQKIF